MIGRLICYFTKHKRGKCIHTSDTHKTFECQRCHATWTRQIRAGK